MSLSTSSRLTPKCWLILFWTSDFLGWCDSKWVAQILQQYLPNGVLNVVSGWLSSSKGICQYSWLASSLENHLASAIHVVMFLMVGSWKYTHLIALLRCSGSRQMQSLPLGFSTMAIKLTQSVGSSTLQITSLLSISLSFALTLSWRAAGMILGGFTTACFYCWIHFDVVGLL